MTAPAIEFVAPAYQWTPPRTGTYGDEAIDLARICGRELDPEQQLAVDAMLSYDARGWVALEEAIIESRQNGKTTNVVLPVVLFDLFFLAADRIVWTAHLFRTCKDAFNDVDACIAATPELSKRVKKITYANGEEAVELHSGAKLEFLARSKGGGRGLGGKRVVMDEALYLSADSMGALLPTLSARPDPQVMYASSAGVRSSDYLRAIRDRGRAAGDQSLIYLEWCAPTGGCADGDECDHGLERDGCALDNEDNWKLANHSLDRRITREYVRQERRAFWKFPLEFARERCGWWDDPPEHGDTGAFDLQQWAGLADRSSGFPGVPAGFAIDVDPDRAWASLSAAGRRADGLMHVEVVELARGTGWVIERMQEIRAEFGVRTVALDGRSPAKTLVDDLEAAGFDVTSLSADDMTTACGWLDDMVRDRELRHMGQWELDNAVRDGERRFIGDAFVWNRRKSTGNISPLVATTVATWAARVAPDYDIEDSFG